MELSIKKIDKDTKELFSDVLVQKRDQLKAKGRIADADEADMFLFCLEQADEE